MSRNLGTSRPYDDDMINDRNLRPLAIAFVTILMGWMLAFGVFFVSTEIGVQTHHLADRPAPIASAPVK